MAGHLTNYSHEITGQEEGRQMTQERYDCNFCDYQDGICAVCYDDNALQQELDGIKEQLKRYSRFSDPADLRLMAELQDKRDALQYRINTHKRADK